MRRSVDVRIDRIVLTDLDLSPEQAEQMRVELSRALVAELGETSVTSDSPTIRHTGQISLSVRSGAAAADVARSIAQGVARHVGGGQI